VVTLLASLAVKVNVPLLVIGLLPDAVSWRVTVFCDGVAVFEPKIAVNADGNDVVTVTVPVYPPL